jgi:hypothetical protein
MSDNIPSRMKTSLIQLKDIMTPKKSSRRGRSSRISKVIDYKAKPAKSESRTRAFFIDIFSIFLLSEFLIFRNAHTHFGYSSDLFVAKSLIYFYVYIALNIIPLRLFGQTGGMIIFNIKLLMVDYSYPSILKLLQRETIGLVMNVTVGLVKFIGENQLISDEIFKTKVIKVERKNN